MALEELSFGTSSSLRIGTNDVQIGRGANKRSVLGCTCRIPVTAHVLSPLVGTDVGPDYFTRMQTPRVRGRLFEETDTASPKGVFMNELATKQCWVIAIRFGRRRPRASHVDPIVAPV